MLPDRVSNPGPLTYESGVLPIALRGPALSPGIKVYRYTSTNLTRESLAAKQYLLPFLHARGAYKGNILLQVKTGVITLGRV